MAATKEDISRWFDKGKKDGATHLLVVCDTYEFEDYPVFVHSAKEAKEKYAKFNGPNMQKVMEVYDISMNKADQLAENRANHLPS
jgi:hypothetical protein